MSSSCWCPRKSWEAFSCPEEFVFKIEVIFKYLEESLVKHLGLEFLIINF